MKESAEVLVLKLVVRVLTNVDPALKELSSMRSIFYTHYREVISVFKTLSFHNIIYRRW